MKQYRPAKKRTAVSVGESVRIVRKLQELSQNQLSQLTGIPQATDVPPGISRQFRTGVRCLRRLLETKEKRMKKTRYTEEQIVYALRQADSGPVVSDICRQMGISEATFYVWKKKYAHLGVGELRKLKQLEDENTRLKRLVADLTLDRHILQEVLRKKV